MEDTCLDGIPTSWEETVDEQLGLTDEEIAALNDARTILAQYKEWAGTRSWLTPSGFADGGPNAGDYGRVAAFADIAEDAIFMVLNVSNSHRVRKMTKDQLHNYTPDAPAAA